PVAVASGQTSEPGRLGGVLERAVALVPEQAVSAERLRVGREGPTLDRVNVEPAVAVVVEQAHAPAHRLGGLAQGGGAVEAGEPGAGGLRGGGDREGGGGRGG